MWFYTNDIRNSLTLYDMYERSKKGHIRGLEVPADTFEKYVPDAPVISLSFTFLTILG